MRLGLPLRASVAASAATVLLLALSACGDEPEEGPLGTKGEDAPSQASATPTATPPAKAETRNDAQGREQFARYVVQALSYAYATNDPTPITDVAADTPTQKCQMCAGFADHLADQKAKGQTLAGSSYPVKKIQDTGEVAKGVWVVDVISDTPAYTQIDTAGKTVKRYPAEKNFVVEIGMTYNKGSYQLTGWKAGEQ